MTGAKLVIEDPPDQVGPLPEIKTIFSPTLLSRAPFGPRLGPLDPRMGPWGLTLTLVAPTWAFQSIIFIDFGQWKAALLSSLTRKWAPRIGEGVKFHISTPGFATGYSYEHKTQMWFYFYFNNCSRHQSESQFECWIPVLNTHIHCQNIIMSVLESMNFVKCSGQKS